MADDPTPKRPVEPASDAKKHANKRVVLSSVAKVAPLKEGESLLGEAEPGRSGAPELPPKTGDGGLIRPVGWTTRPGGTTTIIKLPPKTGVLPRLTSLSPTARQQPPPLPLKSPGPVNGGEVAPPPGPIRLNPPAAVTVSPQESIFAPVSTTPASVPPAATEVKTPVVSAPAPVLPAQPVTAKVSPEVKGTEIKTVSPAAKRALPPPLPPPKPKPVQSVTPAVSQKPEPHHVLHAPPLVPHDSPAPESESVRAPHNVVPAKVAEAAPPKNDPLAQTVRLAAPPPINRSPAQQGILPLATEPKRPDPAVAPVTEAKGPETSVTKHRLPPRVATTARVKADEPAAPAAVPLKPAGNPPKVFPGTPAIASTVLPRSQAMRPLSTAPQAIKSSVTPPTIPLQPGNVRPPTIPLRPAPAPASAPKIPILQGTNTPDLDEKDEDNQERFAPSARAVRKRRRRLIGIIVFYVLLVAAMPCLYFAALYFTRETRVEGQIIPPPGMQLGNEAWIVTDFRDLANGIADDLASDRQIVVQDMQEKLGHVQRAQADVATREARIRLLKDQIQADTDEEMSLMKQARDASQQIWDGPGAQLEVDYQARLTELNQAIAERAKANHLQYNPDPNYYSPEVWANAYRLALYEVPAGVDSVKERAWLDAQMKSWHDFTKAEDQKQNDLRQQATQLKLAPAPKVADLKSQQEDLQQRIDATISEEEPLKAELDQAKTDLAAAQAKEAGLDAKPYEKLDALPEQNVTKRLPLRSNGRFSWREVEKENKYAADERTHVFWVFTRAFRSDGRQYWALNRFNVDKDSTTLLMVEPDSFKSTKAILRPDLSPDEQAQ